MSGSIRALPKKQTSLLRRVANGGMTSNRLSQVWRCRSGNLMSRVSDGDRRGRATFTFICGCFSYPEYEVSGYSWGDWGF